MNNNAIIKFLENEYWATKTPQEVKVVPITFRRIVHGINIYFPAEYYKRTWEDYERIKTMISDVTNGAAWVNTLFSDYNRGYISIIINVAHKQHSDDNVVNIIKKTIKFLKERRSSLPAHT